MDKQINAINPLIFSIRMLLDDVCVMTDKLLPWTTTPIILMVCSGIDFLGGLLEGFNSSSSARFKKFLKKYMARVNSEYGDADLADYMYKHVRSKVTHEYFASRLFHEHNNATTHHLSILNMNGREILFLHPVCFKEEFVSAVDLLTEDLKTDAKFQKTAIENYLGMFKEPDEHQRMDIQKLTLKRHNLDGMSDEVIEMFLEH